jgi:hypothetical protein
MEILKNIGIIILVIVIGFVGFIIRKKIFKFGKGDFQ